MGVIKSVLPILDFDKLTYLKKGKSENSTQHDVLIKQKNQQQLAKNNKYLETSTRIAVNLKCNYCKTPLLGKLYVYKFANIERFFCCKECRTAYNKKYGARIKSIIKKYRM